MLCGSTEYQLAHSEVLWYTNIHITENSFYIK